MRFFFFGSLLDEDVLAVVLGRAVAAPVFAPAVLEGYVRALSALESYPVIVARPGGQVDGGLVRGLSAADHVRIAWFEEGEYQITPVHVRLADGRRIAARACVTRPEHSVRAGDWSLARWQREAKPEFLPRVRAWMELYGRGTVAEAEATWQTMMAAPTPNRRLGT
jgi:hypothetical protein